MIETTSSILNPSMMILTNSKYFGPVRFKISIRYQYRRRPSRRRQVRERSFRRRINRSTELFLFKLIKIECRIQCVITLETWNLIIIPRLRTVEYIKHPDKTDISMCTLYLHQLLGNHQIPRPRYDQALRDLA